MPHVLLTGAGGFVGHHVLEHLLASTSWDVTTTDSFRHKGKTDRITQVLGTHPDWHKRTGVYTHDLTVPFSRQAIHALGTVDYIIAMASESSVDRSIEEPVPFIRNNTDVILSTLELARKVRPRAVVVISTDEVYGPETDQGPWKEWATPVPSNPYSASKAAQEAVAIAYWRTYGVPVIITNTMNLIGERQDPEKYLPMLISRIRRGDQVTVHGVPGDIGTRHYLHARNLADAIVFLLAGEPPVAYPDADRPDRYNIAGPDRTSNLELAQKVAAIMGRSLDYRLVDFHSARPGHDAHYGLDGSKLAALGWKPPVSLQQSLTKTVNWSLQNPDWLL